MAERSSADRHVDGRRGDRGEAFLASHRALAACSRELARLTDEVLLGVEALPEAAAQKEPTVRRSPDRCIVQFGPVALTLAWLRSSLDSVASGELLVMVWRGVVAPRQKHQPERPPRGPAPIGATLLWEQVLTAVAESETSWAWQPREADVGPCSSTELATRCVERLRAAYLESGIAAPTAPAK
jgi:hypothetical protein